MKNLKRIFILELLIIFMVINTICYGAEVTDENLKQAIEKFEQSSSNGDNHSIEVSNNVITMNLDGQEWKMNYDLTEKPTFTYEAVITQGMNYEKFKEETESLNAPMLGFVAVANVQGVEIEDATAYISMGLLGSAFNQMGSTSDQGYIIVDDLNMSEGVTIEKTDDPKTIYASEFGEHVMEYVNETYKETITMNDTDGINAYEWTYKQTDVTENSCKIVSTLSVDSSADFTKIQGYAEQMGNVFGGDNETSEEDNETPIFEEDDDDDVDFSDVETITPNEENKVQSSTKEEDLPKTGINNTIYILGGGVLISIILIVFKIHNYKDVK